MTWPAARTPPRTVTLVLKELTAVVTCQTCANGLVYQGDDGAPRCGECGWESPTAWSELFDGVFELRTWLKRADGMRSLTSTVKAELVLKSVTELRCVGCDAVTAVTGEWLVDAPECSGCKRRFETRVYSTEGAQTLRVVSVPPKGPRKITTALSITCASCGAPLNTDGTQRTVACQFCQAANVVPSLAKARIVYDTMYVALVSDVTGPPRDWAFDDNPNDALQALQAHRYPRLRPDQAAFLLVKHRNSLAVFHELMNHHQVKQSFDVSEAPKLLDSTEPEVVAYARARLAEQAVVTQRLAEEKRVADRQRLISRAVPVVLGVIALAVVLAVVFARR
ncbi:MAG: hypothetical protein JNG84_10550 [Archangium sp.]|nr:hypothetical protein [Archangium sp.]